ncbi:MAG: glycoside hydrolase family 6 protein [bacterium]
MSIKNKTLKGCIFLCGLLVTVFFGSLAMRAHASDSSVQIWWPTDQATVDGIQPFKAMLTGQSVGSYKMYWQVDNGNLVEMSDNNTDYPHKEASVDLSGWNWQKSNQYSVNFVAKSAGGSVIGQKSITVNIPHGTGGSAKVIPTQTESVVGAQLIPTQVSDNTQVQSVVNQGVDVVNDVSVQTIPTQISDVTDVQPIPTQVSTSNNQPILVNTFYVNPNTQAAQSASALRAQNRESDAFIMDKIALTPTAAWFGDWNSDVKNDVNSYVSKATSANATPVLVAYNIPGRDCGNYSSGGSNSSASYKAWIKSFASGIGNRKAIVILEPDALPLLNCLSKSNQADRQSLLKYAVGILKANSQTSVYIDAGHPNWISASDMANSLKKSGVANADGFSLNVSNFMTTVENINYGKSISALINNKHFVIDTSRNGSGSNGEWCNPLGRSLGSKPTTTTGNSLVDAFLWIKAPGESDGLCNGGPSAGVFWESYALDLARNASW